MNELKQEISALQDDLRQNIAWLHEAEQQRDELLTVAKRLSEWCDKYPSSRIYSHGEIIKIADEIDAIGADAKAAIAKARGNV